MASTRTGYLAVEREATAGTAVQPSHFLRFKDGDLAFDQDQVMLQSIQNNVWQSQGTVQGRANTEGNFNFDLDANECVHWIAMALGSMSSSDISSLTDGSVYKHTISHTCVLPTATVEQGKGDFCSPDSHYQNIIVNRAFGVKVNTMNISLNDSLLNMEVGLMATGMFQKSDLTADATAGATVDLYLESVRGLTADDTVNIYDATPQSEQDAIASIDTAAKTIEIATLGNSYTVANNAKVSLVAQTPSYGTAPRVFNIKHASFQFGADLTAAASATPENLEDFSFNYSNDIEPRHGSGQYEPYVLAPRGRSAELTYTKYFETVVDRDRYLRQTKQSCILTLDLEQVVSSTDTNNATYKIVINMSDVRFTAHSMPTETNGLYAEELTASLNYDVSEGNAVEIEVTNAKAGTEYTA